MKDFGEALVRQNVDYKLVHEIDYISGFPSKNIKSWFSKKKFHTLIHEYRPDVIFCDRQSHFALESIKLKIPTYTDENLPKALSSLEAVKPGSRNL